MSRFKSIKYFTAKQSKVLGRFIFLSNSQYMNAVWLTGLPIPPSDNNLFPTHRDGTRRKSKDYIIWLREMDAWLWMNRASIKEARALCSIKPLIRLTILLKMPSSSFWTKKGTVKRLDCQNRIKAICDAIARLSELDDSHVWELSIRKLSSDDNCMNVLMETYELPSPVS